MPVTEISTVPATGSKALDALIARCEKTAASGNDAESRAYLSGIFEVLASEQDAQDAMPLSA